MNSPPTIILAVADRICRANLRQWLCELGYRTSEVNTDDALFLTCRNSKFDLLIGDMERMGGDWLAITKWIRELNAVPMILLANSWTPADRQKAEGAGVICLARPLLPLTFVAAVHAAAGGEPLPPK